MKKLLILLLAVASLSLMPAAPASAHHASPQSGKPHWRSDVHPVVRTPTCYFWGNPTNFCNIVSDAAYYWQDRGFDQGYTPPLPLTGYTRCDNNWVAYTINVCFVPSYTPELHGRTGWTDWWSFGAFGGDVAHLHSAVVYICADCPYTYNDPEHIRIMTVHEFGHALGMEHTNNTIDSTCAMNDPQTVLAWWWACQQDVDHLTASYNHIG